MAASLTIATPSEDEAPGRAHARVGGTTIPAAQLAVLFVYSLVTWTVGNGLLPLLPKYAGSLGADPAAVGIYLGISYAAIALGTGAAGWVADRLGHRRTLMVLVGLAVVPFFLVTSQITAFWQVVVVTSIIWFLGGMSLTFASILAGLWAGPAERGRVLGVLAVSAPTGSILGGLGIGLLADRVGFSLLWVVLGLFYLVCPATGLLVRDAPEGRPAPVRGAALQGMWSTAFLILLVCGLVGATGSLMSSLGRSLAMQAFSNADITSTVAVSGLVTLPFPFLLGFLSDRLGRLPFLALCFAAGVAGLLVYSGATVLWQFWLASALVAFVSYVSTGVSSALVVDLVDRAALGRGLALFSMMGWAGGIAGFAVGGYVYGTLGYSNGFLVGAALVATALLLVPPIGLAIRSAGRRRATSGLPAPEPRKE